MGDITLLIQRARAGEASAVDRLFVPLCPELRRMARLRLGAALSRATER